jgi:hypothetical protein
MKSFGVTLPDLSIQESLLLCALLGINHHKYSDSRLPRIHVRAGKPHHMIYTTALSYRTSLHGNLPELLLWLSRDVVVDPRDYGKINHVNELLELINGEPSHDNALP